jgi:hypothetical protein
VKTTTNKRLLISESRDDLNWCTPCRGKSDQHATRFLCSVCVWPSAIRISHCTHIATFCIIVNRFELIHCPEKKGSQHNPKHTGWPIRGSIPNFTLTIANEAVGKSQASIDNRLLGLPDPYHRHTIDTFNTYSWGSTHRSLIDTDRWYNLEGADLPRTTPRPSQPTVSPFHLKAPLDLQVNHSISTVTNWN